MAVAKQQVMVAIAEIRLLKVHLRRAIFCVREIDLQVYGFLLGNGDKVLKCFGAALKQDTVCREATAQQKSIKPSPLINWNLKLGYLPHQNKLTVNQVAE